MSEAGSHVFGPVWSRRLGRSLGIDLVPFKTCTFDCIYCQLGRTTRKSSKREDFVSVEAVLAEVEAKLATGPRPDYLTISGSGEPTLHSRIGELLEALRERTTLPIAVLTNGSLLFDPSVRRALLAADLVIPSLDAGEESLYRSVNRPLPELTFARLVDGLEAFRQEFHKAIWLEVLLLGGITAVPGPVDDIARIATRLAPDRVQLNAVARPAAEEYAFPVPVETLRLLATRFDGHVEVVADMEGEPPCDQAEGEAEGDLIALLRRRPVTLTDIAKGLGWPENAVVKGLDHLSRAGRIERTRVGQEVFFRPTSTDRGGTVDA